MVPPDELHDGRLARSGTWLVAFLADWCPFSREFAPRFVELAASGLSIARADLTSMSSPLWDEFSIDVVPSVLVFRDGRVLHRADGRFGEGLEDRDLNAAVAAARAP